MTTPKFVNQHERRRGLMLLVLLIVVCFQGCSSVQSTPLPEFETISIIPLSKPSDNAQATTGRNHEKDGFLYGFAAGGGLAMAASATCGPLFIMCATFFTPVAAAVGGTSGMLVGTLIKEDLQSVFGEQGLELKPVLAELQDRRNIRGEMLRVVTTAVPAQRLVDADKAEALISIGPRSIDLVLVDDSELAVRITGELVARWNFQSATEDYRRRRYVHQTSAQPIEHWLAGEGEYLDEAYTECVEAITASMIVDLR